MVPAVFDVWEGLSLVDVSRDADVNEPVKAVRLVGAASEMISGPQAACPKDTTTR
jgi:hypothetical protein